MKVLQKLKVEVPDNREIPLLGIYSKEIKSVCSGTLAPQYLPRHYSQ